MKRILAAMLCLLMAALQLLPVMAEDAESAEAYRFFRVEKTEQSKQGICTITGCWGDIFGDTMQDNDDEVYGFTDETRATLQLASDCILLLPKDMLNEPWVNETQDSLTDWYKQACGQYRVEAHIYYVIPILSDDGLVSCLTYQYFPEDPVAIRDGEVPFDQEPDEDV